MERLRNFMLALVLALAVSVPSKVLAWETPTEFYNNVADAVGVHVDIAQELWRQKTITAYYTYVRENWNVSSVSDIIAAGGRLEEITTQDVVYVQDGRWFMNHCPDGAGGALYSIEITAGNFSACYKELTRWLRYIVTNGPGWPYQGEEGGGDGSTVEVYSSPIVLYGKAGTTSRKTLTATSAQLQNINATATDKYSVMMIYVYGSTATSGTETIDGQLAVSNSPIEVSYQQNETGGSYRTNYTVTIQSESQITYRELTPRDFGAQTSISSVGAETTSNPLSSAKSTRVRMLWTTGEGVSVPAPTDDTPPADEPTPRIEIDWPDIVFPGITLPDFETTNNITNTSGEIDWTPVTQRLDKMNDNMNEFNEMMLGSFNSYRSDMLRYWDAMGDALDGLDERLWTQETQLRQVIQWLKNIFDKMGTGSTSVPDPTDYGDDGDDGGFWGWLGRFLDNLIGDLPDGVGDFASALSVLTGKFPFSVPWDIMAVLGVMSQSPQTPEFDVDMPVPSIGRDGRLTTNGVHHFHVDLSEYDDLAYICRRVVLLLFTIVLAAHTIETLRGMSWAVFD